MLNTVDFERLHELHNALPANPRNEMLLNTVIEILKSYCLPIVSEMVSEISAHMLENVLASIPGDEYLTNRKIMHMAVIEFLSDIHVAALKHRETKDDKLPEELVRIEFITLLPGEILCVVIPASAAKACFHKHCQRHFHY